MLKDRIDMMSFVGVEEGQETFEGLLVVIIETLKDKAYECLQYSKNVDQNLSAHEEFKGTRIND